jgi:3-hydroxyacyl-CoA dehydrogenase/enoyl-CoA hydratase/3-hydroxybutyryl-CoA epimerase
MNLNIKREILDSRIALLLFDRPDSVANIFDQKTFDELNGHLDFLETEKDLLGLIIQSAKPRIFIAGADLHGFGQTPSAARLSALIEQRQKEFDRIEKLPYTTVAAIHGIAFGGGLEIALACDFRVASSSPVTKVGLPETSLGILPAWGGSTRLPKLIGLPNAFEVILSGKQFGAEKALRLGIVDSVTYPERLLGVAIEKILGSGQKKRRQKTYLYNRTPISKLVRVQAEKKTLAKTRGNYPAPMKALEVAFKSLSVSHAQSLENEKNAFIELALEETAQNLIRIFFLQERAKKLELPAGMASSESLPAGPIGKGMVIGSGLMGSAIAQWLSARGIRVLLKDIGPEPLAKGMQSISKIYAEAVKRRVFTVSEARKGFDRVVPTFEEVPLAGTELVIEAVVERLDLKQKIFAELEAQTAPTTLLASNTSALSIDSIAAGLTYPDRVIGIHFFNPVHRMQLVEIVRGAKTSGRTLERALRLVRQIGKLPVIVKDSPGFMVNRILLPYLVEAVRLFRTGYRLDIIDKTMLDFGMPMGPLRLIDEVGLDVSEYVANALSDRIKHLAPIDDTLQKMIARGWLGRKSGKGFYDYSAKGERPNSLLEQFPPPTVVNEGDVRDRLTLVMVNEAARTLEEKVVDAPDDVDFGMIMGSGWAPFRGGPLRFADALGVPTVVSRLSGLAGRVGAYFEPCALLLEMANRGLAFYPKQQSASGPPDQQP